MAALLKNMLQARLISNKEGEAKDQVLFLSKQVQAEDFKDQLLILQHHSCDTHRVYSALYKLTQCWKRTLGLKIIYSQHNSDSKTWHFYEIAMK